MPVLGITGGVGTGKSLVARLLSGYLQCETVDADSLAHRLLEEDRSVRMNVSQQLGSQWQGGGATEERGRLREVVFRDPEKRRQLEQILHPAVRREWLTEAAAARAKGGWLCVELPLLFEVAAEAQFDRIVVAACSPEVQRARLLVNRGLCAETVDKMIASQLELRVKIQRGDHMIWNDSTVAAAERQCVLLSGWLNAVYG
jgi:dephospho-CoA kinase